jgi:hypothetical protein
MVVIMVNDVTAWMQGKLDLKKDDSKQVQKKTPDATASPAAKDKESTPAPSDKSSSAPAPSEPETSTSTAPAAAPDSVKPADEKTPAEPTKTP